MFARVRSHLRGNVYGILALFVAIGGTAYAVDGPNPGQNTIGSEDIIGNEVKSDDIGNGRIFNLDIADDIIQGGKIKDDTIGATDLQDLPAATPMAVGTGFVQSGLPAGCYVDPFGIAHLEGGIHRTGTPSGGPVVDLPPGCEPVRAEYHLGSLLSQTVNPYGVSNLSIATNGTIGTSGALPQANEFLLFDGITFKTAAASESRASQSQRA